MSAVAVKSENLLDGARISFLTADVAAAAGSITVESIKEFAINQILFIGEPGDEKSEIIKTHASTAPTGSTVTLAANLASAHLIGTKIYIIDYDQIEFSTAATIAGTKTVLSTENIEADSLDTLYADSTTSTGYFFTRFKNSITSAFSDYSAAIPVGGFEDNTVYEAIDYAMKRNKMKAFTENVDHDFLVKETNDCLKFIRGKLKKWHRLQNFDYQIGTLSRGQYKFTMPTDSWQYSFKSILDVRVSKEPHLAYVDKREFDALLQDVAHTTLSITASAGSTSITLTDSHDFVSSGTVNINGIEIIYTANNTTTGVLSGIAASGTGSITATITAGDNVWQGESEGEPDSFTVYNAQLMIWPLPSSTFVGRQVLMDYWKEAPTVDSDADTLDILRYDMVKYWLTWVIRAQIKNDGIRDKSDPDYLQFLEILNDAKKDEASHGQKYKKKPKINSIFY